MNSNSGQKTQNNVKNSHGIEKWTPLFTKCNKLGSLFVDSVATKTCRNTALIDRLGGTKKRRTASQTSATHSFDTVTSTWATLPAWSSPLSLTDATSH